MGTGSGPNPSALCTYQNRAGTCPHFPPKNLKKWGLAPANSSDLLTFLRAGPVQLREGIFGLTDTRNLILAEPQQLLAKSIGKDHSGLCRFSACLGQGLQHGPRSPGANPSCRAGDDAGWAPRPPTAMAPSVSPPSLFCSLLFSLFFFSQAQAQSSSLRCISLSTPGSLPITEMLTWKMVSPTRSSSPSTRS
jgi:hypothetical protein